MKPKLRQESLEALSITLLAGLVFICFNLLIEIYATTDFRGLSISNAYITMGGKPIGHSIYAYFISMLTLFFALTYSSKE